MKKRQTTKPTQNFSKTKQIKLSTVLKKRQSVLDFSQKQPGVIKCNICHLEYQSTIEDDIKTHEKYHKEFLLPPKLQIKNNEYNIIQQEGNYKYIKFQWNSRINKEIQIINERINEDIEMDLNYLKSNNFNYICCIENNRIIGIVITRVLNKTHSIYQCNCNKYDDIKLIEQNKTNARLAIEVLWVHKTSRRKMVASHLLELTKIYNTYGTIYHLNDIAISQPTHDGFSFFNKFFNNSLKIILPN
ncbi:hypothetical protein EDI_206230 [Entamoeba dispar SAW760]|uniref:N-acetyltransferase ECO1 n=1 Tax=Entamoeba dispar (strain ATCC PRA-260 / SAW760) TaxID=370354 RepID=B0EIK4_ENTDS|nr:uncharacterized protein EDI_206230 [Entamoeba dispar SAW760]EDR25627.1 hypothetical protein EDI_206230 [Entamoeba dispar SAW760]|eukprot:EDR25627.1 hypothetical protein EDI_206230 [Entamoeba dispar SAW760]